MKQRLLLFLQILLLGVLVACEGQGPDGGGDGNLSGSITLLADRTLIRANGSDSASLTVLLTDDSGMIYDVTADAEIYCGDSTEPMATTSFTTSSAGDFSFYALYGMAISNDVEVKAVAGISDLPADSNKESTDFAHRLLLIQHTGTACPNCPKLMNTLKLVAEDEAYAGRYYHIASHSYNTDDKAYSSAAANLSGALGVKSYPWLNFNFVAANGYLGEEADIKNCLDLFHEERAAVAIAASSNIIDGVIYANVGVKAAEAANYFVGVWVLEDNIQSTQSSATASWQNNHNNCLRGMAGESKNERIYGHNIGRVESGATSNVIMAVEVDNDWYTPNCKLLVFITTDDGKGNLELVNSTLCPVDGSVAYAYN